MRRPTRHQTMLVTGLAICVGWPRPASAGPPADAPSAEADPATPVESTDDAEPPAEPQATEPGAAAEPDAATEAEQADVREPPKPAGVEAPQDAELPAVTGATDAKAGPPEPTPTPTPGPVDEPPRTRLTWLGWAGVIAMALGAGSLGTGIGLVAYQSTPARCDTDPDGQEQCTDAEVTSRPEGWILMGAGAAVFTAGLVRVLIDRPRRRRAAASAYAGPNGAGASVRLRF